MCQKIIKLLTVSFLLPIFAFAQSMDKDTKKDIMTSGIVVTTGGVALTIGSVFTASELQMVNGRWQTMPIYKQDARFAGVITGCTITASGVLSMILTHEPKTKRKR